MRSAFILLLVPFSIVCVSSQKERKTTGTCSEGTCPSSFIQLRSVEKRSHEAATHTEQEYEHDVAEEEDNIALKTSAQLSQETGEVDNGKASSQTTEDEQPDCCDTHFCLAFGDPHFVTFDGVSVRGLGPRTPLTAGKTIFWLVKSDSVKIQGSTYGNRGITTGFAATGSWLNGHNLTLEMDARHMTHRNHKGNITVTWDGVEILDKTNDEFVEPGLVTAKRGDKLITKEHLKDLGGKHLEWMNFHGIKITFRGQSYHFTLPNNVQIFVDAVPKGWGMGLLVKMGGGCGGTKLTEFDGWCGPTPFGGQGGGAGWNNIMDWTPKANFVDANEIVFPTEAALAEVDADGSMTRDSEMDIHGSMTSESETCNGTMTREEAEDACKIVWDLSLQRQCISDVCVMGDRDAALDALAAEFLEVEDGRGISVFVGNGHCLDHNGNQYTAFEKADITTADECKSALKQLVGVKAVRGAQLKEGHGCQILVDSGHILSPLTPVSKGEGTALIVSVGNETGCSCWRLN